MPYVIGGDCIDVNDRACVDVCPVDCIYVGDRKSYINPAECIDCGACEPECPVDAIFVQWKGREDEDKAQSLGVPTFNYKLTAFVVSAFFTALGGGMYALWFGFLTRSSSSRSWSAPTWC